MSFRRAREAACRQRFEQNFASGRSPSGSGPPHQPQHPLSAAGVQAAVVWASSRWRAVAIAARARRSRESTPTAGRVTSPRVSRIEASHACAAVSVHAHFASAGPRRAGRYANRSRSCWAARSRSCRVRASRPTRRPGPPAAARDSSCSAWALDPGDVSLKAFSAAASSRTHFRACPHVTRTFRCSRRGVGGDPDHQLLVLQVRTAEPAVLIPVGVPRHLRAPRRRRVLRHEHLPPPQRHLRPQRPGRAAQLMARRDTLAQQPLLGARQRREHQLAHARLRHQQRRVARRRRRRAADFQRCISRSRLAQGLRTPYNAPTARRTGRFRADGRAAAAANSIAAADVALSPPARTRRGELRRPAP